MSNYKEIDFACLPGPTHNFGALAYGNKASEANRGKPSNPQAAIQQVITKIAHLGREGVLQVVLPPHERPHVQTLRSLGFSGTDQQIIEKAHKANPMLLTQICSSSAMWSANAATVAPSCDTMDGKLHITPASMQANFHRAIEAPFAQRIFEHVFRPLIEEGGAEIHQALPYYPGLGDEGAANHMRFANDHGEQGVHLFVYGKNDQDTGQPVPQKYPARQQLSASQSLARLNRLPENRVIYVQQNPDAIDAGVFHNDVISVANLTVWMLDKGTYLDTTKVISDVRAALQGNLQVAISTNLDFETIRRTYVFNSQIVSLPNGQMMLIAAKEAQDNPATLAYIQSVIDDPTNPISKVEFFDLTQSMNNGGGPACLRLRIAMSEAERGKMQGRILLDQKLELELRAWADKYYPEHLEQENLRDPQTLINARTAYDELTQILQLGSIYDFQR